VESRQFARLRTVIERAKLGRLCGQVQTRLTFPLRRLGLFVNCNVVIDFDDRKDVLGCHDAVAIRATLPLTSHRGGCGELLLPSVPLRAVCR
jgi:hypothetical protein